MCRVNYETEYLATDKREIREEESGQDTKRLSVPIDLVAYRISAEGAAIFIFVSFGQHQEKGLLHRNGAPALNTIEFRRLEFIE